MDRQDINRVARTIRSLMSEKRYEEVVRIAEKLNLGKVNNGLLILNIVEAYENLGEKTEAKNTLFSYYDVHGITGRNMMQKLIELCIETRDISNAVGLCIQFENEWPDDSISYLMRYQITASGDGSYDEQIHYLEKYKEYEFEERWGYELARLYEKNNQWEDCARICHELICFFGDGKYVEKAVRLKERIDGLTDEEISILDAAQNRRKMLEEEFAEANDSYQDPDTVSVQDTDPYIQQNDHTEEHWDSTPEMQQAEFYENDEKYDKPDAWSDSYIETESEDVLTYKTREAKADKIRQTEEAAKALRTRKENERIERERKIADVFSSNDRYAQLEKGKIREIHFQEFSKPDMDADSSAIKAGNKGILSSLGKVTEGFRKTLHTDEEDDYDYGSEVEYITIGRESRAYIEDIEERMLSELDMLDDEQIDRLTSSQIKEIYELKVLREVREKVAGMLSSSVYKYDKSLKTADMETFIETDPYQNPIEEWDEEEENEDSSAEDEFAEEAKAETKETEPEVSETEEKETEAAGTKEIEVEVVETKGIEVEAAGTEAESEVKAAKAEGTVIEAVKAEEAEVEITEVEETKTEADKAEEAEVELTEIEETKTEAVKAEEVEAEITEVEETEAVKAEEVEAETAEAEEAKAESGEIETKPEISEAEEKKAEAAVHTILDDITDSNAPLSNEMFLKCVISYAEIMEYTVEETAYMTIAVVAEEMQEKNVVLSLNNAKILTEQAVLRAQKRSRFDKIFDKYSKKRMHILKDRHFYWK